MVATATMIEGSLDVLSCATLMQLAELDLPASVNGAIVIFSLLELINAIQSFALQVLLSGGHDDTPLDLVKWKGMSYHMTWHDMTWHDMIVQHITYHDHDYRMTSFHVMINMTSTILIFYYYYCSISSDGPRFN